MKCRNCDYELNGERFCPQCGCESIASDIYSSREGEAGNDNFSSVEQGFPLTSYSMKWYKAVKVLIIIGAVLNIISAVSCFTGASYQGFEDEVYDLLPSLRAIDLFVGVYCIGMAVFNVFVWNALRNYKTNGPKLLIGIYALNLVVTLIESIACILIVEGSGIDIIYGDSYVSGEYMYQEYLDLSGVSSELITSVIGQTVGCLIMIAINRSYFKKRQHMFVN